jgi:DNA-binding response OmpR family regulator
MSGQKVLIVDDDSDVRRGLGIRLKANGYNVVFAADGISAISAARKEEPEVIILDLGLPAGDGFSVMERLGTILPVSHVPIIVLTAREISGNKEKAINAGAQAFLQKPVDNEVLLETIRNLLAGNGKSGTENRINETKEDVKITGQKVLIVDDDKDVLRGLSIRLKANGYNVVFAADGISAIGVARKEEPQVIVLDLGLPAGDGFNVMERLASLLPVADIPIIILTAREIFCNKERALNAGAKAFLQKPVDNDVLLATIQDVLHENSNQFDGKGLNAQKGTAYTDGQKVLETVQKALGNSRQLTPERPMAKWETSLKMGGGV